MGTMSSLKWVKKTPEQQGDTRSHAMWRLIENLRRDGVPEHISLALLVKDSELFPHTSIDNDGYVTFYPDMSEGIIEKDKNTHMPTFRMLNDGKGKSTQNRLSDEEINAAQNRVLNTVRERVRADFMLSLQQERPDTMADLTHPIQNANEIPER